MPYREYECSNPCTLFRCRIVSCSCSCSNSFWCQHVVAACLARIRCSDSVQYRPAIWDSITAMRDNDLKKLAQYLINELPREVNLSSLNSYKCEKTVWYQGRIQKFSVGTFQKLIFGAYFSKKVELLLHYY